MSRLKLSYIGSGISNKSSSSKGTVKELNRAMNMEKDIMGRLGGLDMPGSLAKTPGQCSDQPVSE